MRLLLLSNSRNPGKKYLEHARSVVDDFLGDARRIAFVPYAAVGFSSEDYESMVATGLSGREVVSVHRSPDPVRALQDADTVAVGGGNTFRPGTAGARIIQPGLEAREVAPGSPSNELLTHSPES